MLNRFCDETGVREDRKTKLDDNAPKKLTKASKDPEDFEETVEEKAQSQHDF